MELIMATGQANAEIMWGGCPTLNNNHEQPILMSDRKDATDLIIGDDVMEKETQAVACDVYNQTVDGDVTASLTSTSGASNHSGPKLMGQSIVRRLTPLECERLQGMPDNWSKYGINEKGEVYKLPDSARYRLQGNGIATPFWRYLLKRISAQYERTPTLGSLFDGQASFPMIWEGINGKGTALWSSEIEKHAVAVAKYHFPDERKENT